MSWSAPRTWVAGEIVTAALGNTHWRDNLRYLKGLDGVPTIESGLTIDNTDGDERLLLPLLTTAECTTVLNAEGEVAFDETTHQMKEYDGTAVRAIISEADVDDTPVNGATTVPISSNWAYDFQQTLTTQGDLPYATAAGVWARLAKGTANQLLKMNAGATAPEWGGSVTSLFRCKTATETVNNSTTLQNDDDLVIPVGANENWEILLCIKFSVANSISEGTDIAFSIRAGGSIVKLPSAFETREVGSDATAEEQIVNTLATDQFWMAMYLYIGGANAGNIQLQWAQHVAHASNNIFQEGSFMVAHNLG